MKETKNSLRSLLLALVVMALWGSLFPFVKIGYSAFGIKSSSIPDILMFAGMRFALCGIVLSVISMLRKKKLAHPRLKNISLIMLSGVFSIILHYFFTYVGLSVTDSSKTALIKQLGPLLYACFAFIFVKDEKFNILKIVGAIVGFAGIIAINYNPAGIRFSTGDVLIICASVCSVVSSMISKITVQNNSPFLTTAISQLFGGVVLVAIAFVMGAEMLVFNIRSTLVFTYICIASMGAYVLYAYLLRTVSVSKMFIIKFTEPLFACVFGAILLGENIFRWQYLIAFILISLGIALGNKN